MKKIFLIIFLGSLLIPSISSAGTYIAIDTGGAPHTIYYDGLVPCGKLVCETNNIGGIEQEIKKGNSLQSACTAVNGTTVGKIITGTHGEQIQIGFPCTFCHLFVMLDGIIDFVLLQLVPVIAVLMLVIGGVMFALAGFTEWGLPFTFEQAKKLMTSVVIGLVIIFAAWLIIDLFFRVIGVVEWTGLQSGWFSIKCPIALP